MRVHFSKNHHVQIGERSRRMYKRGQEYEVVDEVGKAAVEVKRAKAVADNDKRSKDPGAA